jgi:hypothetical protein
MRQVSPGFGTLSQVAELFQALTVRQLVKVGLGSTHRQHVGVDPACVRCVRLRSARSSYGQENGS